ncbi:hypothetical protein GGR56DRAFT_33293 [Xylariaceae sp. FL0804]|nr:hypothetical protein GGR56DRAFT_33293 [Xylariaceae sp. FL0804]
MPRSSLLARAFALADYCIARYTQNKRRLLPGAGNSMRPAIDASRSWTGSAHIYTSQLESWQDIPRGTVVSLMSPLADVMQMKRLVALPGDIVRTRSDCNVRFAKVPPDHVWVEGDGGAEFSERDSNYYGPAPIHLLADKGTHVVTPFNYLGPMPQSVEDLSLRFISDPGHRPPGELKFRPVPQVQRDLAEAERTYYKETLVMQSCIFIRLRFHAPASPKQTSRSRPPASRHPLLPGKNPAALKTVRKLSTLALSTAFLGARV